MELSAAKPISNAQNQMRIQHPKLGVVDYSAADVFFFPQGLLGYERKKSYVLVEKEEFYPFVWMLNTEDESLNFLIVNPLVFYREYDPNISKRDLSELQIDNPQSLSMYVIITLDQDIHKSTGNLSAPILLNMTKRIGKQLVLLDDKYSTKYPIYKPE